MSNELPGADRVEEIRQAIAEAIGDETRERKYGTADSWARLPRVRGVPSASAPAGVRMNIPKGRIFECYSVSASYRLEPARLKFGLEPSVPGVCPGTGSIVQIHEPGKILAEGYSTHPGGSANALGGAFVDIADIKRCHAPPPSSTSLSAARAACIAGSVLLRCVDAGLWLVNGAEAFPGHAVERTVATIAEPAPGTFRRALECAPAANNTGRGVAAHKLPSLVIEVVLVSCDYVSHDFLLNYSALLSSAQS